MLTMCGVLIDMPDIHLKVLSVVELKVKNLNQLILQIFQTAVAEVFIFINSVVNKASMSAIYAFTVREKNGQYREMK